MGISRTIQQTLPHLLHLTKPSRDNSANYLGSAHLDWMTSDGPAGTERFSSEFQELHTRMEGRTKSGPCYD